MQSVLLRLIFPIPSGSECWCPYWTYRPSKESVSLKLEDRSYHSSSRKLVRHSTSNIKERPLGSRIAPRLVHPQRARGVSQTNDGLKRIGRVIASSFDPEVYHCLLLCIVASLIIMNNAMFKSSRVTAKHRSTMVTISIAIVVSGRPSL